MFSYYERSSETEAPIKLSHETIRPQAEQTDEWAEGRRYLGLDILAKSRLTLIPDTEHEVTRDPALELSA